MFKNIIKKSDLDVAKVNETVTLASKVLKVTYALLIALGIYLVLLLFKETNILHFLWTVMKIVAPLFIGIIIAWLFDPFVRWLKTKGINRTCGAIITYLIMFGVVFAILATLIPLLGDQIGEFIKIAPGVFESVKGWCLNIFGHLSQIQYIDAESLKNEFFLKFNEFAAGVTKDLPAQLFSIVTGIFSGLGTLGLGVIIGFFLLVSFDSSSSLFNYIPRRIRNTSINLLNEVNGSLRKYVQGAIIDCSVIFILTSIGLWIIGLKAPALFGFFCGITNIIPYLGPYIGGAPAAIVGFTQSPTIGILTIVVIVVIQFLEGNFLQPFIMSKTTKLHPVTIMLGLLVFGYFFGMIGMLISTPVLAALKTVFRFFDKKYGIIQKDNDDILSSNEAEIVVGLKKIEKDDEKKKVG